MLLEVLESAISENIPVCEVALHRHCDMSYRYWATGCGTSYHEDRLLINGRLPSYAKVERCYATVSKAVFFRAEPSRTALAAMQQ
jgi:hypothetical protein